MTAFAFTIDDAGMGGENAVKSFVNICRQFERRDLKITWFVIPRPNEAILSTSWRIALQVALKKGHDLQMHAVTHVDCFEFGPPSEQAGVIYPNIRADYERRRLALAGRYRPQAMRAQLQSGFEVFNNEWGIIPQVFRAPCGSVSKVLFSLLREHNIGYHSGMQISSAGYEHLEHRSGRIEPHWSDAIPHRPFVWYNGIVEAPLLNEYTWQGAAAHEAEMLALLRYDLERVVSESPVALIRLHAHALELDPAYAMRVVDLIQGFAGRGGHSCTTLGALASSGALMQAAVENGPNTLEI